MSYGILWVSNDVSNSSLVLVYLVVVAASLTIVAEEMDVLIFVLNVLETECLVPSFWEDVERDLSTD